MTDKSNKGQRVEVTFTVIVPVDATVNEIENWIDFSVHNRCDIKMSNPLCDHEMSAAGFVTKRFFP